MAVPSPSKRTVAAVRAHLAGLLNAESNPRVPLLTVPCAVPLATLLGYLADDDDKDDDAAPRASSISSHALLCEWVGLILAGLLHANLHQQQFESWLAAASRSIDAAREQLGIDVFDLPFQRLCAAR